LLLEELGEIMKLLKSALLFGLTLAISFCAFTPIANADDTDIYTGTNVAKGASNILLSIDTSGSMLLHVVDLNAVTIGADSSLENHPEYDSSIIYDNRTDPNVDSDGCYDNYLYAPFSSIFPYVQYGNTRSYYKCSRDTDFGTPTLPEEYGLRLTASGGLYNNAVDIGLITCPAALQAFAQQGYFRDTNFVCADTRFRYTTYYTGRFLDFVRKQTNLQGEPIDTTGNTIPWSNFFVQNRLDVVKDVVNDIIDNDIGNNINIGIMRFSQDNIGGYISQPTLPLLNTDGTNNSSIQLLLSQTINEFTPSGLTPLQESFYEGSLYMRGLPAKFGLNSSVASSINNGQYISPITHACQKSAIILLTDGSPSADNTDTPTLILNEYLNNAANFINDDSIADGNCVAGGGGPCMDELAQVLSEIDIVPDDTGLIGPNGTKLTSDLGIKQTATVHTVGFFNNNTLLRRTADAGDGLTVSTSDPDELKQFFRDAIGEVLKDASSFTSPSISVNNFNRLANLDDLYFTLFEPSTNPLWEGNLKKYRLENGEIVDVNNQRAIDPITNKFYIDSRSYWMPDADLDDGNKVGVGGFASRLQGIRSVYSNLNGTGNLATASNEINTSNIAASDFSSSTTSNDAQLYIDWLNGIKYDPITGNNVVLKNIGDTLHTTPQVISYNFTGTTAVDQSDIEQVLFFGTNAGFLHGIDVNPNPIGSMEHFAFFPKELLNRVPDYYSNNPANAGLDKLYGLDGPISYWIENDNGNGIVDRHLNEKVHLYVTMRRGGRSVYAFDITDFNNPILEWVIDPTTPGFSEMGQSWSIVTPAKIHYGTGTKSVLIFGGGYDADTDTFTSRTANSMGRAIYIVNADGANAGELLWKADVTTHTRMDYSIPANLSLVDINADGVTDRLYFGDMGGQLWRFDMRSSAVVGNNNLLNITGDVIADLAGSRRTDARLFYNQANVALVRDDAFGNYLAISIGSGKRADPRSTSAADKFYMIKDPYIIQPKLDSNATPVYTYDGTSIIYDDGRSVKDITNNVNPTINDIGQFGWSLTLPDDGEKVLSPAFVADFKVFFTSYIPDASNLALDSSTLCTAPPTIGGGRLYAVSLLNGKPVSKLTGTNDLSIEFDENDPVTADDRSFDLNTPGIPAAPQLIFSESETNNTTPTASDSDNDGIFDVVDVDYTGGEDKDGDGQDDYIQSLDTDGDSIADYMDVDQTGGTDSNNNGIDDSFENTTNPTGGCNGVTDTTLVVGTNTFIPPICNEPVKSYWQRY